MIFPSQCAGDFQGIVVEKMGSRNFHAGYSCKPENYCSAAFFFVGWGFYCAGTEHIRIAGVFEETVFSRHRFSVKQVCYSCPAASVRVNPVFIYE